MTRAIVLGAGVLGASVAYHLARAGSEVTVIEARGPAGGTSSATFSIDVTHLKTPRSYYEFNRRSARKHRELAQEDDGPTWLHPLPLIQWGGSAASQQLIKDRQRRLESWGHPCRLADRSELAALEPNVAPDACTTDDLVVHDECAWYDAPLFTRRMLERAAALGADVRYGLPVDALIVAGDRVRGVVTGTRRWEADWVVNCAGTDAGRIADLAGTTLPLKQIPGLVGESGPLPGPRLGAILATPGVDLRPAPGGRVCSISWSVDAMLWSGDGLGEHSLEQELHHQGEQVLPALRQAGPASVRVGVRPVPDDGLPLVGTHAEVQGLYSVVSHSGVTLAPLLGELVADELTNDRQVPDLSPYRPTRDMAHSVQDESLRVMSGMISAEHRVPDDVQSASVSSLGTEEVEIRDLGMGGDRDRG